MLKIEGHGGRRTGSGPLQRDHGKETPTLAKVVLYVTLSVLYVPAQNFRMKNKATSAYYSRMFNRRCDEYTNTGNLCLPKAIPIQNLNRSASNSRVSTAAVEVSSILLA